MTSEFFLNEQYQRHNRRRQEHLASLGLSIAGKTVLELGAGVGDHTSFFIDRGCTLCVTDARPHNLEAVQERFPGVAVRILDIDSSDTLSVEAHDIVYAYGLLYHCSNPGGALTRMSALSGEMLLLETCVAFGENEAINQVAEDAGIPTQSIHGLGCRPTRPWIFSQLKKHFPYVYNTVTQPWHEEFPVDWRGEAPANLTGLYRSVFVASRQALSNSKLSTELVGLQRRHD